jgi:DNA-binding NtrC family response regulator
MESAVLFAAGSRIDVADLPDALRRAVGAPLDAAPEDEGSRSFATGYLGKTMAQIEKEAILTVLQTSGGNRRRAAEALDIGLRTLQRKLKEYRGETGGPDDEDEGDAEE